MKRHLLVVAALIACGGAGLRSQRSELSSGHTGCPPNQIKISEETDNSWKATCAGKDYYCSGGTSIQCKEAVSQPAPAVKLE
jgi:hypothetical protein